MIECRGNTSVILAVGIAILTPTAVFAKTGFMTCQLSTPAAPGHGDAKKSFLHTPLQLTTPTKIG